jgi:hypothetical protein
MKAEQHEQPVARVAATDRWIMYRREAVMADGRRIVYYTFEPKQPNSEEKVWKEDKRV